MGGYQDFLKWREEMRGMVYELRARYHCASCGVKYPTETKVCPDCGYPVALLPPDVIVPKNV